jgi:YceI-like domain
MPLPAGRHEFGPDNAKLTVHTTRGGAASKAGHDLLMEVTSWSGAVEVGDETSLTLSADAGSFKVREGSGGMMALDDDDRANIEQTIDDEVLHQTPIEFRSTSTDLDAEGSGTVEGELELSGATHPVSFALEAKGGRLTGRATVKQSDWGMKPYSALFGTLKVTDEVEVAVDAELPT